MNHSISKFLFILSLIISFVSYAQYDYSPGFDAGAPDEMNALSFLEGNWEIELYWTDDESKPMEEWVKFGSSQSKFDPIYDGTFIRETSKGFPIAGEGHEGFKSWAYESIFSYDRFNQTYRYVAIDNIMGLADIYEGEFSEDQLVLSNWNTSTFNNQGSEGTAQKNRLTLQQINNKKFHVWWHNIDANKIDETSVDQSPWEFAIFMIYKKQ